MSYDFDEPHQPPDVPVRTKPCRHCSELIELESKGCNIQIDVQPDGFELEFCRGYNTFDFSRDVELEYDNLCAKCFYNPAIPRGPSLCSVLFEGAEPDEKMQAYLETHPVVASWKKSPPSNTS